MLSFHCRTPIGVGKSCPKSPGHRREWCDMIDGGHTKAVLATRPHGMLVGDGRNRHGPGGAVEPVQLGCQGGDGVGAAGEAGAPEAGVVEAPSVGAPMRRE
jgi:hypothetical protein